MRRKAPSHHLEILLLTSTLPGEKKMSLRKKNDGLSSCAIVSYLAGMSDIWRPKSSVALFQQATALEPRTSSPPRGS